MWIKICGMTSAAALAAALEAQADAIGFVFAPSVRQLTPAQAARLATSARAQGRAQLVAVTLHPSQTLIDEILRELKPDVLQSDLADFALLRLPATLARLPVLRTGAAPAHPLPQRLLFEGARSGSGSTSDWQQAALLARQSQLVLAGGLRADNVAMAIAAVRPVGVDVSSGVESAPGDKRPEKIVDFVRAARAAVQVTV